MPLWRRRALEAAILEALPIAPWAPGCPRPARAYPRGWKRPNLRRVVSDVEKMLASLGARVGRRTIERALRNEAPYRGQLPRDEWAAADDGRASVLIRRAADLLGVAGGVPRGALIDRLYAWCLRRCADGLPLPASPVELARAYRAELTEKRATK